MFATVLTLGSLAYPSVTVSIDSTEIIVISNANTSTYFYFNTMSTLRYQSITRTSLVPVPCLQWSTGNDIGPRCIWPATFTYAISTQSTTTSTSTSTSTMESVSTSELVHTHYENVPMYASVSLNTSQFVLLAISIIVAVGLAIFYARRGIAKLHQTKIWQCLQTTHTCLVDQA